MRTKRLINHTHSHYKLIVLVIFVIILDRRWAARLDHFLQIYIHANGYDPQYMENVRTYIHATTQKKNSPNLHQLELDSPNRLVLSNRKIWHQVVMPDMGRHAVAVMVHCPLTVAIMDQWEICLFIVTYSSNACSHFSNLQFGKIGVTSAHILALQVFPVPRERYVHIETVHLMRLAKSKWIVHYLLSIYFKQKFCTQYRRDRIHMYRNWQKNKIFWGHSHMWRTISGGWLRLSLRCICHVKWHKNK